MIRSFRCPDTEKVFNRVAVRRFQAIANSGLSRLLLLHAARSLKDLAAIRGNHLEALKRGRQGQHSVRINDRWRICFEWAENDAYAVEIVDYH